MVCVSPRPVLHAWRVQRVVSHAWRAFCAASAQFVCATHRFACVASFRKRCAGFALLLRKLLAWRVVSRAGRDVSRGFCACCLRGASFCVRAARFGQLLRVHGALFRVRGASFRAGVARFAPLLRIWLACRVVSGAWRALRAASAQLAFVECHFACVAQVSRCFCAFRVKSGGPRIVMCRSFTIIMFL